MKPGFQSAYFQLLAEYLRNQDEKPLAAATDLGRDLVLAGIPPEDIGELHANAMARLAREATLAFSPETVTATSTILSEVLMAYGLVFRQQLAERQRREEQVRQSLQEKVVLLAEIHHRVKNNLQIISSLFNLQARFSKNKQLQKLLNDSQSRIKAMALIHEKLYQTPDLANIPFDDYVKSLTTYLQRLYGGGDQPIALKLDIEPVPLDMDQAVPYGLIITELVSNALKYAFPGGQAGEIQVSFRQSGKQADLTIGDNGIGLPGSLDYHKGETLGLQLVHTLVRQLKGSLERLDKQGTWFQVCFAASPPGSPVNPGQKG